VETIKTGLACVSKLDEVYHRVLIKENHVSTYVVAYVDLGMTEEMKMGKVQFKHLLNYFASLPCMAITCRLMGVHFKLINYQTPPEIYKELSALCQGGSSFFVEPYNQINEIWGVKIYDADQCCLNDIVVEKGLAVCIIFNSELDVTIMYLTRFFLSL
jgi:hypothetical protein